MSYSFTYPGERAYDMQEFINSMAEFVITLEDSRKGFVLLVPLVSFPDQGLEWFYYLLPIQLQKCFPGC